MDYANPTIFVRFFCIVDEMAMTETSSFSATSKRQRTGPRPLDFSTIASIIPNGESPIDQIVRPQTHYDIDNNRVPIEDLLTLRDLPEGLLDLAYELISIGISGVGFSSRNEAENTDWIWSAANAARDFFIRGRKDLKQSNLRTRKSYSMSFEADITEKDQDGLEVTARRSINGKADVSVVHYPKRSRPKPLVVFEVKEGNANDGLTQCLLALKAAKTAEPNEQVLSFEFELRAD